MDGRVGTSPSLLTFPPLFLSCIFLILYVICILSLSAQPHLFLHDGHIIFVYISFMGGWKVGGYHIFKYILITSSEALDPTHILWKVVLLSSG